jgi:hypothetical protein
MNLSVYPNLSRAYEVARNGKFRIQLTADIDIYPNFIHDLPLIKRFYKDVNFISPGHLVVDLWPPNYENATSNRAESMHNLNKRIYRYKETVTNDRLNEASRQLMKTATERVGLTLLDLELIPTIAKVIANMEYSSLIETNHIAEAIQYRMKPEISETQINIIDSLKKLTEAQLNKVQTFIDQIN